MIKEKIENLVNQALAKLGVPEGMVKVVLDHPADPSFGDYSTNVAMLLAKSLSMPFPGTSKKPIDLAQKIASEIEREISGSKDSPVKSVAAAQPGFINFHLSNKFFADSLKQVLSEKVWYGKNTRLWNKKIIIEHTNLNPFKPFHIGHLVNNAIGESLSRILEFQDVKLTRASYGGDVGLHVAKTLWGVMKREDVPSDAEAETKVAFLGECYVAGNAAYEADPKAAEEIKQLNKKIFEKSDEAVNALYDWGREASLSYFQELYKRLDTRIDVSFYESQVADDGMKIVEHWLEQGVFEKSDGAIIFPGEKYGLHSRVFITSQGLPTYEAKELGLTKQKFELHDFDTSIVITAPEQNDYFRVVLKAMEHIYPEIARRTKHLNNGLMRFASGKMSSRAGNVIAAEALISDIEGLVYEKIKDREFTDSEKKDLAAKVALGAIKYSILKQSVGRDIIFDPEKSISFEGDSGPYIQYTYVRAKSILAKAKKEGIEGDVTVSDGELVRLEKMLYLFPEIVERASNDEAPNYIATYLTALAGEFNSYYASTQVVDQKDPTSAHKVALTEGLSWVIKNGLWLLGIAAPEKM